MLAGDWAVVFQDDFSTDTSGDYTVTAPLARPGSVLPTLDISGGDLTLTSPGQTGDVTQAITFHNSASLGIGETVLLDVDFLGGAFGAGNEMLGLTVSAGIMAGVDPIPPASDLDFRDDEFSFVFGGFRSSGTDHYRSGGFIAVDQGEIAGGEAIDDQSSSLSNIASLYVTRTDDQSYELGWMDASEVLHLVRTVDIDLGASPLVGIFTDFRTSTFSQSVDNLRIVREATPDSYPENPVRFARQVEDLNRGVVAVRQSSSQVYVGWRMLGTDATDVAFNLYRVGGPGGPLAPLESGQPLPAPSGPSVKLNGTPLTQTTDFVDSSLTEANLDTYEYAYYVAPVIDGVEQDPSELFTLEADSPVQQFMSIPLQKPADGVTPAGGNYSYNANDASVGDLDGDGQYEIILKWDPSNAKDNSQSGYTGNVYLDAYSLTPDATGNHLLWRIDLGHNIRAGAHYTQFLVYDFDGDGRAEVATKTAPGTIDGNNNPVLLGSDQVTDDYRNSSGYILTGPEYLTVFDGLTGAELDTIPFFPARGGVEEWGDTYGNRVDRFTAGVAYLDGVRPSLVYGRGYYGAAGGSGLSARNELAAFDFRDGQLTQRWLFEARSGGVNADYIGQGAHSLSIADVDGDGFDEVVYGAAVIDHDGSGLYSTGLDHGDALHVSDMVPSKPGLEIYMPHENASGNGNVGSSLRDAMTGELIVSIPGSGDIGRGVAADVDPDSPGYEFWDSGSQTVFSSDGQALDPIPFSSNSGLYNFAIWWDADHTRELLSGETIYKWNNPGRTTLLSAWQQGAENNNGSKQTPALQADLFGDWREEVIWRTGDNTALQVWTTTIPATHRIYTLMHDTQYREAVAWQNVGYNQPPHPSFFIGAGMDDPPAPLVYVAGGLAGDYNGDDRVDPIDFAVWREAAATQDLAADGDRSGAVDQGDYDVWLANYGAVAAAATPMAPTPSALQAVADAQLARGAAQPTDNGATAVSTEYASITSAGAAETEADSHNPSDATDAALAEDDAALLLLLARHWPALDDHELPDEGVSSADQDGQAAADLALEAGLLSGWDAF